MKKRFWESQSVPTDYARKLDAELIQAREALKTLHQWAIDNHHYPDDEVTDKVARAMKWHP